MAFQLVHLHGHDYEIIDIPCSYQNIIKKKNQIIRDVRESLSDDSDAENCHPLIFMKKIDPNVSFVVVESGEVPKPSVDQEKKDVPSAQADYLQVTKDEDQLYSAFCEVSSRLELGDEEARSVLGFKTVEMEDDFANLVFAYYQYTSYMLSPVTVAYFETKSGKRVLYRRFEKEEDDEGNEYESEEGEEEVEENDEEDTGEEDEDDDEDVDEENEAEEDQ